MQKEKEAKEAEKLTQFRKKLIEAFNAEDGERWSGELTSYDLTCTFFTILASKLMISLQTSLGARSTWGRLERAPEPYS